MLIVDANNKKGWQTPKIAHYIQPETFEGGKLTVTLNPTYKARKMTYSVPKDLSKFVTISLPPNESLKRTP